jgi:glycerol-3-phosphate acyltransferase PlsX
MAKSFMAKVGYRLAKHAFDSFRKRVDYAEYGGAPLLGLNGTGIVCHGRSNAKAIMNAIKVAAEMVRNNVNEHITQLLDEFHAIQTDETNDTIQIDAKAGEDS